MAVGRWGGALLLCGFIASGCSSSYTPAVSPRLQIAQTSSGLVFVRDGRPYEHGFFGKGLREAVAGVPAEAHATTRSGLLVGGFVLGVGSVGLTTASIATAVGDAEPGEGSAASLALACGALGAAIASSIMYASAAPHR